MLRSSRTAFAATLACATGLLLTALAVRYITSLQARDVLAVDSFRRLDGPRSSGLLDLIAAVGDPLPYALIGLAAAAVAYARGRIRIAIAIPILLAATGAATQALKHLLNQGTLGQGSFPSGHATAVLTLALCAVLAAPARLRPLAVVAGAALAAAVSYAIVSLGWHTPSDILAGFLVAATLTGAAVTLVLRGAEHHGEPVRRTAGVAESPAARPATIAGLLGLAGVAALAAVARADGLTGNVGAHATAAAAAAVIAALAATLLVVFARIAR